MANTTRIWEPASQRSSEVMCRLIWQTDLVFDVFFSPVTRTHPTSQDQRLQIIRAGLFESAVNATSSTSRARWRRSGRSRRTWSRSRRTASQEGESAGLQPMLANAQGTGSSVDTRTRTRADINCTLERVYRPPG